MKLVPVALLAAGAAAAALVLGPYRSEPFPRSDGTLVRIPGGDRLHHTSDTWDYLQLGRRLATGQGFTSRFTYVPFLPESVAPPARGGEGGAGGPGIESFPLFWRQPGFPVMVAGAMRLLGPDEPDALLALCGLGLVVLPLAAYRLARSLLPPGWAALAALWTVLVPLAVGGTAPLVATTWFAAVTAMLAWAMITARGFRGWLGAGALLGLGALFRLETWILAPGLLVMHLAGENRRGVLSLAVIVGTAALVTAPWNLRLRDLTGDPFYNVTSLLYHATPSFPGWESSRTLEVRDLTVLAFVREHPGEVAAKTGVNLLRFLRDLVLLPSPFLAPLLWLAVLRPPRDPRGRAFVAGGVVMVLGVVLGLAPMEYSPRFLAPLVPLLAVGAVLGIFRLPRLRTAAAWAATGVGLVVFAVSLEEPVGSGTADLAARDVDVLHGRLPDLHESFVALSDSPTVYAWIWDRPAVWLPVPRDLPAVRELLPGSFLQLTRAGGRGDALEEDYLETVLEESGASGMSGPGVVGGGTSPLEPPLVVWWPAAPGERR